MKNKWGYEHESVSQLRGQQTGKAETLYSTPYPEVEPLLQQEMDNYLLGRALDPALANRAGWYPAYYRGPRIVIPCSRTDSGSFWQARLIEQNVPHAARITPLKRWDGASGSRYDAVCYIFAPANTLVVVEGPMDALAVAGQGYPAVAVLGADPPPNVIKHVAQIATLSQRVAKVIILPDMDRLATWQHFQHKLGMIGVHAEIKLGPLNYKDIAECPLDVRKEFFDGLKA